MQANILDILIPGEERTLHAVVQNVGELPIGQLDFEVTEIFVSDGEEAHSSRYEGDAGSQGNERADRKFQDESGCSDDWWNCQEDTRCGHFTDEKASKLPAEAGDLTTPFENQVPTLQAPDVRGQITSEQAALQPGEFLSIPLHVTGKVRPPG